MVSALLILLALTGCASGQQGAPQARSRAPEQPLVSSAPNNGHIVTRADLGATWPLTVPGGNVACYTSKAGTAAVFTTRQGKRYGINGTAQSQLHLPPIQRIRAADPSNPGLKKDISPLLDICIG